MASVEQIRTSFLDAEARATALADQLRRLKEETDVLAEAGTSVSEAGTQLAATATTLSALCGQAATTLKTLEELGTPRLMAGIADIGARLDKIAALVSALEAARSNDRRRLESLRMLLIGVGAMALLSLAAALFAAFAARS